MLAPSYIIIGVETMTNPVVEQLTKWAKRQKEQAEHDQYTNMGKQQAYEAIVDHINQTCMECGEYSWSLDRLSEHMEDKHPSNTLIEVSEYNT